MILITGGLGFIGMHVARQFAHVDDVALTYHRSRRTQDEVQKFIDGPATLVQVDAENPYSVADAVARYRPSGIIHLAVPGLNSMAPAQEIQTNVNAMVNVLEAARLAGVSRLTVASSVAVYGGISSGPYREDDPLPVASPSATTAMKKAIEVLALYHAEKTGVDLTLLRIGMIYGPLYHSLANLPSRLLHYAIRERPLSMTQPDWASDRMRSGMDLCYVKDCAAAIARIHQAPSRAYRVYNVSAGRSASLADIVAAVREVQPGVTLPPELGAASGHNAYDTYMSIDRAASEFGYAPEFSLSAGFRDYAEWLRHNEL